MVDIWAARQDEKKRRDGDNYIDEDAVPECDPDPWDDGPTIDLDGNELGPSDQVQPSREEGARPAPYLSGDPPLSAVAGIHLGQTNKHVKRGGRKVLVSEIASFKVLLWHSAIRYFRNLQFAPVEGDDTAGTTFLELAIDFELMSGNVLQRRNGGLDLAWNAKAGVMRALYKTIQIYHPGNRMPALKPRIASLLDFGIESSPGIAAKIRFMSKSTRKVVAHNAARVKPIVRHDGSNKPITRGALNFDVDFIGVSRSQAACDTIARDIIDELDRIPIVNGRRIRLNGKTRVANNL